MTEKKLPEITLLGVKQSKIGNKFLYLGETSECSDCRLRGACLKLEKNRVYEVSGIRETIHPCNIFEEGVKTVEIFEPSYLVTTGAKLAVEGAIITFTPRKCDLLSCPYYRHNCCPEYLQDGEKLKIINILDKPIECNQGYRLIMVSVTRINNKKE